MEVVKAHKAIPERTTTRPQPPSDGRKCRCGRKISRYNPNDACWQHAPLTYPRIRGREYNKDSET